MDLTLRHYIPMTAAGVYGYLLNPGGESIAETLEHAYPSQPIGWAPKVVPGVYLCVLGPHRLHGMTHDFLTYEVTGVPHCTGILFHWGNWNTDSQGCILLGTLHTDRMITDSKVVFDRFMALQQGCPTFSLTVVSHAA